jgi:hypothetical protein
MRGLSIDHDKSASRGPSGHYAYHSREIEIKLRYKEEHRMDSTYDAVVDQIFKKYESFGYSPPNNAFSVLAAFYVLDERNGNTKIISIATGSKCLPTSKFSRTGDTVRDFHAEVLARRGAVRWLMQEMPRGSKSEWLERDESTQMCRFKDMVSIHMYVSTLPCMSTPQPTRLWS